MRHPKQHYIDLVLPNEFKWVGYGDLPFTHIFCAGDYKTGFSEFECSDLCIDNGDAVFLAENKMTCGKARLKKLSSACLKLYGVKT